MDKLPMGISSPLSRRDFLCTTAGASALLLTVPTSALAAESKFSATSNEIVYFRGWQFKPEIVQQNVDRYNKLNGGHVDYQTVSGDYPSLMEKSMIAEDKLDIIYTTPSTAVRFYEAGWIKPVDDLKAGPEAIKDMYDNVREAWTHQGKLMGFSYFLSVRGLVVVNRARQAELGISDDQLPKNWDEFYAHIGSLSDKGVKDVYLPHWFNEYYGANWAFLFEIINRNGTIVDPTTRKPVASANNAVGDVLKAWKTAWKGGHVPQEILTYTEANVVDGFASGRYLYSAQAGYNLAYFNDKEKSKIAGKVGFLPYRGQGWGGLDSALYSVTNRERDPQLAEDVDRFISYYGYKDNDGNISTAKTWLTTNMMFSAYRSVMESSETVEVLKRVLARESDAAELLTLYGKTTAPNDVWQVVWAEEFMAWLHKRLPEFLLNDESVDSMIADITSQVEGLNKKYNI
jgi:ABC-type glycerol-3-phosphate transport system substrate-binding protein